MAFTYAFWVLAVVAAAGLVIDVAALRRRASVGIVWSALGLKGVVAASFLAWWIALRAGLFQDWADLAVFAGLLVISVPVLLIAVVCDVVALKSLRTAA